MPLSGAGGPGGLVVAERDRGRAVDIGTGSGSLAAGWDQENKLRWIHPESPFQPSAKIVLLARLDERWPRVPQYKPLSVGVVLLDLVPAAWHQPDLFAPTPTGARNCRRSSTASTTGTAAARSASACFRATCGRSRATPPFTGCRRSGNFSRISGVRGDNARIEICVDEPDFPPM